MVCIVVPLSGYLEPLPGESFTSNPYFCSYTGESGDLVPVASSIAVGFCAGNTRQGAYAVPIGRKLVRIRQVCVHSGRNCM